MSGQTSTKLFIICTFVTCLFSLNAHAEIYKYRDANGKWQFTDKKPEPQQKTEVLDYGQKKPKKRSTTPKDSTDITNNIRSTSKKISNKLNSIGSSLKEKFNTTSPVEKTAIAVIGIDTMLSTGSGFFISEDGYILTNKHVIHPDTKIYGKKLEEEKKKLAESKRILDIQKSNLKIAAQNINTLEEALKAYVGQDYLVIQSELKTERLRRESQRKSYKRHLASYKEQKLAYKDATNILLTASTVNLSQHFKITLKDGNTHQALLVATSTKYDLALLKVDTQDAPFVDISNPILATQGAPVFAIGNPLGLNNYVTAGIIAQMDDKQIYTDAQILPGNSGGPLITKDGHIIGINTAKLTTGGDVNNQGFGIAIPISTAIAEFSSHIIKPIIPEQPEE